MLQFPQEKRSLGGFAMRQQLIVASGPIDPELALKLVQEYLAEVSKAEFYDDVKAAAPELIEYVDISDPRVPK